MTIQLRLADPDRDFLRLAELLTAIEPQPTTPEMLHEWENRRPEGLIRQRLVAAEAQGYIIGYSVTMHAAWDPPGRFYLWVGVDESWRQRGVGAQLYEAACRFAGEHAATVLTTEVADDCSICREFAERRGFAMDRHIFESTIDLASFDESRFAGLIQAVEATGIRITSLAEIGDTGENRRKLHHLNYQVSLEDPGSSGSFPSFEEFNQIWDTSAWFRPAGQIIALDGDCFVGLAAVGYFVETNSMYNLMTGVDGAYRGRKLAQAMKLESIRYAKTAGAAYIRTNNDSENGPMLAINRKLGYRPQPGHYRLIKDLREVD